MTDDLSDLPPEVLKELRLRGQPNDLEQKIIAIIVDAKTDTGIDMILIELWRRHKIHETRKYMMSKLYRMAIVGMIDRVPRKKGIYRHAA